MSRLVVNSSQKHTLGYFLRAYFLRARHLLTTLCSTSVYLFNA